MASSQPAGPEKPDDGESPILELRVPRWVKLALIPGVVGPVFILGFIFVSELAHDEKRCPYAEVSTQTVGDGVVVREDRRRCLPAVEERRYTAVRGTEERVIGRRRFAPDAFDKNVYNWHATLAADRQVYVSVHNDGHTDAELREGTAAERAQ